MSSIRLKLSSTQPLRLLFPGSVQPSRRKGYHGAQEFGRPPAQHLALLGYLSAAELARYPLFSPGRDLPSKLLGLCWLVLLFCSVSASASGRVCARGVADQSLTGGMEVVMGGGDAGLLVRPELNSSWPLLVPSSSGGAGEMMVISDI